MKALKKLFLVLLAVSAISMFVSCADDEEEDKKEEDKSVSVTFTLLEDKTYTVFEDGSYIFESNKTKIDGDEVIFFLYLSDYANIGTGANTTGTWMFGLENIDETTGEIDSDYPLTNLYKGNFVDNSKATVLNRTHIVNSDFEWTESAKAGWKTISIENGKKYFKFTITEDDIKELEKIFPDNQE